MWPALAALAIQKWMDARQQREARKRARREAAAGLLESSASRLGTPTYNVDAARTEARLRDQREAEKRANMSDIVSFMGKQNFGGGGEEAAYDPIQGDMRNNPPASDRGPYAGRTLGGQSASAFDSAQPLPDPYELSERDFQLDNPDETFGRRRRLTYGGGY